MKKKFDVKKLTKKEIQKINFIRKFDDIPVVCVHIYIDDSVFFNFRIDGSDVFVDIHDVSFYVKQWICYVWLKMINRCNNSVVVFDHAEMDNPVRESEIEKMVERDAEELVDWLTKDYINKD